MHLDLPTHPNITTATNQIVAAASQYVTDTAKALRDSLSPKQKHMEARLLVLKDLGFKSEHHFTCFKKRLHKEAATAWRISAVQNCIARIPSPHETYYAFSGEVGLIDDGDKLAEQSIMTKNFRTLASKWTGVADDTFKIDLRVATPTDPDEQIADGEVLGIPTLTIESRLELSIWFLRFGGIALIPERLVEADRYLARWLSPYPNTPGWKG